MHDEGLEMLVEAIDKLQHLRSLVLNFGYNELSKNGTHKLLEMIDRKELKNIWLGLSNNQIGDSHFKQALPTIQNILKKCPKW